MDDRESVILSEVREGEIPYDIHYVWELLEMIHMKLLIKQTHRLRKRTYGCQGGRIRERIIKEFWNNLYTVLYLKWISSKVLLYSTGNSTQC